MKLLPLHNFVLVKRLEAVDNSVSGIIIPDMAIEKTDRGEVIAASAGKRLRNGNLHPLEVRVGDRVLFGKRAGQPVIIDGDELLIMREDDIFAVLENFKSEQLS
jgi:chaperonin GroES